jgi:hypothetical protein
MEDLQQQFDALTEQKKALWEEVKNLAPNYEFEGTPQWEEIKKLDAQLRTLQTQIQGGQ